MRVCMEKLTGKLIESQSGGEMHLDPGIDDEEYASTCLDTLRQNAIRAGHLEKDIEVKFVDDKEFKALVKTTILPPTEEQIYEEKIRLRMRELAIASLEASGELLVKE